MDTSRKSFKTYSLAQHIKKEIDETLFKVELEKRKFLTLERQEVYLKDVAQKKLKELNALKAREPETRTNSTKTGQTSRQINNVDRNSLNIHDSIQQLKHSIVTHRRQISKYKDLNQKLQVDIANLTKSNEQLNSQNIKLEDKNEQIKNEIIRYRESNLKNGTEFYQSHTNINRSDVQDENQRRKVAMQYKSFLGEEMKNSKIVPLDGLSEQLRESGIKFSDHANQIMTQSLPLAKDRIRTKIYQNKEKLKITENYRRFGENLEIMFNVMKQYKGRDDLTFIAQEFVTKQKQLQKIEEYIGQLESRILKSKLILKERRKQDQALESEVNHKIEKKDKHYAQLQVKIQADIEELKAKQKKFYQWFTKVSDILMPLTQESLTRSNASNLIGGIEQSLNFKREQSQKKSPSKGGQVPLFQVGDKQSYNQLLSYQKMREMAAQYVKSKRN